jgi:hypothetical protein
MAGPCNATFERLARDLGGNLSCTSGNAFVDVRAPWHLTNWTLPVIEVLMVGGAIYALVHAVRRWRAGDPTTLSLAIASLVFLAVIEPPIYFPDQIRIPGQSDIVFAHNAFTVEFLWDRLPLYIVALYPAMIVLAYEIVRCLGVFRRRGAIAGAVCVGFVYHCFYEVFDHLGPQLRWWTWNTAADASHPTIASVPMSSIVVFATVAPAALAGVVYWLVGRPVDRGDPVTGGRLLGKSILAGFLMLVATALGGLPWRIFNTSNPNQPSQIVAMSLVVAVFIVAGAVLLVAAWNRARGEPVGIDTSTRHYVARHGLIYLATFAVLWATALPAYLDAVHGVTGTGTRTGSLVYASLCFAGALGSVLLAITPKPTDGPVDHHAPVEVATIDPTDARSEMGRA